MSHRTLHRLLVFAMFATAVPRPALAQQGNGCCLAPHVEILDPNNVLVINPGTIHPSYRILFSPSGKAHQDAFGSPFQFLLESACENNVYYTTDEAWLGPVSGANAYLGMDQDGRNPLFCSTVRFPTLSSEFAYTSSYVIGEAHTFYPSGGALGGEMGAALSWLLGSECVGSGTPDYMTMGPTLSGRSTDFDGDGDTDEDDEKFINDVLAGLNNNPAADLDQNGVCNAADLNVLVSEELRNYATPYRMLGVGNSCNPAEPYDPASRHMHPPTTIALAVSASSGCAVLSWLAPNEGFDAPTRASDVYEIRRSPNPINDLVAFLAATPVTVPFAPGSPNAPQSLTVVGGGHFAIRSRDNAGNWSAISVSVNSGLPFNAPPAQITNLSATPGREQVRLGWTAPGEDGACGTATSYEIRSSTSGAITSANWAQATVVTGGPVPGPAGTVECYVLNSLPCVNHWFAVRAVDAAGQLGAVSNSPVAKPKCTGSLNFLCGGASAIPVDPEESTEMLRPELGDFRPNPAATGGQIRLALPSAGNAVRAEVGVFDVMGRHVRTLLSGEFSGVRTLAWDLRNDAGMRVRPGLYVIRATAGAHTLRRTVVVTN